MKLKEAIKITKKRIITLKLQLEHFNAKDAKFMEIKTEIEALEMVVEFAELY